MIDGFSPGKAVRNIREALHLTLEEFGARLGVTRAAVSNIEHDRNGLTEQMKVAICDKFNASYLYLSCGEGDMFEAMDEITAIHAMIDELAESENAAIISLLHRAATLFDAADWRDFNRLLEKLERGERPWED